MACAVIHHVHPSDLRCSYRYSSEQWQQYQQFIASDLQLNLCCTEPQIVLAVNRRSSRISSPGKIALEAIMEDAMRSWYQCMYHMKSRNSLIDLCPTATAHFLRINWRSPTHYRGTDISLSICNLNNAKLQVNTRQLALAVLTATIMIMTMPMNAGAEIMMDIMLNDVTYKASLCRHGSVLLQLFFIWAFH